MNLSGYVISLAEKLLHLEKDRQQKFIAKKVFYSNEQKNGRGWCQNVIQSDEKAVFVPLCLLEALQSNTGPRPTKIFRCLASKLSINSDPCHVDQK